MVVVIPVIEPAIGSSTSGWTAAVDIRFGTRINQQALMMELAQVQLALSLFVGVPAVPRLSFSRWYSTHAQQGQREIAS